MSALVNLALLFPFSPGTDLPCSPGKCLLLFTWHCSSLQATVLGVELYQEQEEVETLWSGGSFQGLSEHLEVGQPALVHGTRSARVDIKLCPSYHCTIYLVRRWCGFGNTSTSYEDLGVLEGLDK